MKEADRRILGALAEYQQLTNRQLARVLSRSEQKTRKKIGVLANDGFIDSDRRMSAKRGSSEKVFFLTPKAATQLGSTISKARLVKEAREHSLLINETRINAEGISSRNADYFSNVRSSVSCLGGAEYDLRLEVPTAPDSGALQCFVPDGVMQLTHRPTAKSLLFFLEIDRGTEALRARSAGTGDIHGKLIKYRIYFGTGRYREWNERFGAQLLGFRVLFVTLDEKRANQLVALARTVPFCSFVWVTGMAKLLQAGIEGEIWSSIGREDLGSLLRRGIVE